MSKLIFIISLMGIISIPAFANPPAKKTSPVPISTWGKNGPTQTHGFAPPSVQIPCDRNHPNCLEEMRKKEKAAQLKKEQQRKAASAPKTGEDKIKADCHAKVGNYGDKYQKCLSDNGVFAVERNVSSDDNSKSDARLCYVGDPLCDKCLAQSSGAKTRAERRNQVQACLDADAAAKRAAAKRAVKKEKTKVKEEKPKTVAVASVECTAEAPHRCATKDSCEASHGVWNGRACAAAPCPVGTTPDPSSTQYCKCDDEGDHSVERGTDQICPNACRVADHKVYEPESRSCTCADGYRDNVGTCVAANAPPADTVECLSELQEKVTSCNSAATTAVDQCNPEREKDDTIGALQNLLKGAAGSAMGASQNCAQAAVAGSTGYYALDELRGKCDTEISSCKTSCADATSYINANKDRVYNACREKAFREQANAGPPLPPDRFNPMWDAENKAKFEQQIQEMKSNVATNNGKCETGTAVTNREKMSNYMTDMDNTFKSASQCECQLSSGGSNCANQVGPKDCSTDPTLPGCVNAQVNCLNPSDTSQRCACFRDPNSDQCKNVASLNVKSNSNINGFAGPGNINPVTGVGVTGTGGGSDKAGVAINPGDFSGLNSGEVAAGNASGTTTADAVTPFGSANGGGSSGVNGNFGSGENTAAGDAGDSSTESRIRGMFNSAKGAFGSLFGGSNKKNNSNETSSYGSGSGGLDANGNPMDSKKWRPGRMVRGLASGSDTEIAGKFEDIWKVMNRQYKVQDQKDSFIFGEKN